MPPARASASQSVSVVPLAGSSWPVTTVTWVDSPRCVTGMPAYAGAAIALVMPGTTSNGTPAAISASASSPPRPNTNGSPPFRRTTVRPASPCSTIVALISSWVALGFPGVLPTSTSAAPGVSFTSRRSMAAVARSGMIVRAPAPT